MDLEPGAVAAAGDRPGGVGGRRDGGSRPWDRGRNWRRSRRGGHRFDRRRSGRLRDGWSRRLHAHLPPDVPADQGGQDHRDDGPADQGAHEEAGPPVGPCRALDHGRRQRHLAGGQPVEGRGRVGLGLLPGRHRRPEELHRIHRGHGVAAALEPGEDLSRVRRPLGRVRVGHVADEQAQEERRVGTGIEGWMAPLAGHHLEAAAVGAMSSGSGKARRPTRTSQKIVPRL